MTGFCTEYVGNSKPSASCASCHRNLHVEISAGCYDYGRGGKVGADKLEQQHEGPTSVYCGQWLEKIQLVEPILRVNLSAKEWSASLLSLLFFITLVLITMRGLMRRPIDYR
jgi:hypothetical protein